MQNCGLPFFPKMFHEAHMSHAIAHTGWLTLGSVHWPGEQAGGGVRGAKDFYAV